MKCHFSPKGSEQYVGQLVVLSLSHSAPAQLSGNILVACLVSVVKFHTNNQHLFKWKLDRKCLNTKSYCLRTLVLERDF